MTADPADLRVRGVFVLKTPIVPSLSSFGITGNRVETRYLVSIFCDMKTFDVEVRR